MRFASRASCWRWKAVLERSPAYVMVALAARGPIRTECGVFCFVLFCLTLNQTASWKLFIAPETVACRGKTELA